MTDYKTLSIIRARRRERLAREAARAEQPLVYVNFSDWLRFHYGIEDWRTMRRYDLWDDFNEYQLDCLCMGMEYEKGAAYGLSNTLM